MVVYYMLLTAVMKASRPDVPHPLNTMVWFSGFCKEIMKHMRCTFTLHCILNKPE